MWIVEESILDYAKLNFLGNITHPSLITLLCIKGGVKFNEEEDERCLNTSPLNLAGVLKAPVESEEGERRVKPTKKRKRAETEAGNKDEAHTVAFGEGDSSERGGFKANLEHPMLSPTAEHEAPAQTGVEEKGEERENEESSSAEQLPMLRKKGKGKKRATTEERNNFELLALLKEMKKEIRERDEQIREELKWRDNHLEDKIKKRENSIAAALL